MKDIIVIGGGVMGMLAAIESAAIGHKVTLIEKRSKLGLESTWAAGGLLLPLDPWNYRDEAASIGKSVESWQRLQQMVWDRGISIDFEIDTQVFFSEMGKTEIESCLSAGIKVEAVDSRQLFNLTGVISDDTRQAVRADSGVLHPLRVIKGLTELINSESRIEVIQAEVLSVVSTQNSIQVQTVDQNLVGQKAVLAAGAWSSQLAPKLMVYPVRGQMVAWRHKPISTHPRLARETDEDSGGWAVITPSGYAIRRRPSQGEVVTLFGSTTEDVGFDNAVSLSVKNELVKRMLGHFPATEYARKMPDYHWSGLRPACKESVPQCLDEYGRYWALTGHFRHGICLAPVAANELIEKILL